MTNKTIIKKVDDNTFEKILTVERKMYLSKDKLLREKETLQKRIEEIDADLAEIENIK